MPHQKVNYGDPPPPNRKPAYQKKLDAAIELVQAGAMCKEAAEKAGVSTSALTDEYFRRFGRYMMATPPRDQRTPEEQQMWATIVKRMEDGESAAQIYKDYKDVRGVSLDLIRREWYRSGHTEPRSRRSASNPRYGPVSLAMMRFLSDGEWHPASEVFEVGGREIRPEYAIRWLETRRRHAQHHKTKMGRNKDEVPPRKRAMDYDQQVYHGRRGAAQQLAQGVSFIERKREGGELLYRLQVKQLPGALRKQVMQSDDPHESEQEAP